MSAKASTCPFFSPAQAYISWLNDVVNISAPKSSPVQSVLFSPFQCKIVCTSSILSSYELEMTNLKLNPTVSFPQTGSRSSGIQLSNQIHTMKLNLTVQRFFSRGNRMFCSAINQSNGGVSMVQGASRGIGLEFVRQLLEKNKEGQVVATCRNPNGASALLELKNRFAERLDIHQLDLTIDGTIEETAKSVKDKYGKLNLLINASGILSIPGVLQPETTLSKVQRSSLLLTYEVNAIGPILVIKHMWPLLKVGGGTGTDRDSAIVASISARVGSIGDNRLGGWHSYRSSKSALNQLTKTVSVEFARKKDPIVCILLHPGTVDTDLSKPFQGNVPEGKLFTKEYSVQKLLGIINDAKKSDNGKFFAWDGQEIPW